MPLNSQIITGMPLASAPASSTSDSVCVVGQPLTSSFFNGGGVSLLLIFISELLGVLEKNGLILNVASALLCFHAFSWLPNRALVQFGNFYLGKCYFPEKIVCYTLLLLSSHFLG